MAPQQALEESLSSHPITLCLKIHINHLAILVDGSPKVMLLPVDFDDDFIHIEGVTVTSVLSLQSPGIKGSELDTPQVDRFTANCYATLGQLSWRHHLNSIP